MATTYNQAMYEARAAISKGNPGEARDHCFAAVQLADNQDQIETALGCAKSAGATKPQLAHGAIQRSAGLSDCQKYRYWLVRSWDLRLPQVRWVMLNPSTANADVDDPTIRKCVGFATSWGFGSIRVVNLFALRSTDPKALGLEADPVGPLNAGYLAAQDGPTVVAWGGSLPKLQVADMAVTAVFATASRASEDAPWWCLGSTKGGKPRHPLMLAYKTGRKPWPHAGGRP